MVLRRPHEQQGALGGSPAGFFSPFSIDTAPESSEDILGCCFEEWSAGKERVASGGGRWETEGGDTLRPVLCSPVLCRENSRFAVYRMSGSLLFF